MTLRSLFVDFNSYFASVEQEVQPALRGRPLAVVPVAAETTCCIAASYEAKAFGIGTGTLVAEARALCPGLVLCVARPALYVEWHHRLLAAIGRVLPIARVGSIDEVACELIGRERQRAHAEQLALQIKAEIAREATAIRCSIGIAANDFLAKTAADMRKPDGLTVIEQADLPQALHGLALRDLCGIGAAMEARLHAHGIRSVAALTAADAQALRRAWGSIEGARMAALLRGAWLPAVAGERASIGHSHVLGPELRTLAGARAVLHKLLAKAALRLRHHGLLAGALSVRVRFLGVEARWEADLAFDPCDDTRSLLRLLARLTDGAGRGRLPGPARAKPLAVAVTLHRLVERARTTPSLFGEAPRARALDAALDRINARFGPNAVHFGGMQRALDHAAAPMRIPFSRIPDIAAEDESGAHALWQQAYDRARVLAEAAHRRAEQGRPPRDAKLEAPRDPRRRP